MAMELTDYSESNSLFPFFVPQRKVIFVPGKGQGCGIDLLSRTEEETEVKSYDSFERSNFETGIQFKDFSFSVVVDEAYKELEERIGESLENAMNTEEEKPVSPTFDLTSIRDSLPKLKVHAPEKIHDEDFGAFTIYRRCDWMVDCNFSCCPRDAISPRQNSGKDLPINLEADENMSFNSLDSSMTTTTRSSIESLPKVFYDPNLHRHQLDLTSCHHNSSTSANLVHVVPKRMEPAAVSGTNDVVSATTTSQLFPSNQANVKQPFFQRACLQSTPILPPSNQLNSRPPINSGGSQAMVKLVFPSPSKASNGIGLRPFSRFNSRLMNDLSKIHLSASLSALPPVTPTSDDTDSCMTTSESNLYTTCSPIKCGNEDKAFPIFSSSPSLSPLHTHHFSRLTSRQQSGVQQRLHKNHSSQSSLPVTVVPRRSTRFQSSSTSPTAVAARSLKRPKNWTENELSTCDPVTKKSCLKSTRLAFEQFSKPASEVVKSSKRRSNSCSKMVEFGERKTVVTRSMCSPTEAKENRNAMISRSLSASKISLVRKTTSFKTANRSKILDLDTLTLANTIYNSEKHIKIVDSPAQRKNVTTRQQRIKFKEEVATFRHPKTRQQIEQR